MTPLDDAWQDALAAEHQAVFGYPLLGPRLSGADRDRALSCALTHETLRDSVRSAMTATGLTPVATEPDYPSLYPVPDAAAARRLAVRLEDACAAAWRFLYARAAATSGSRAAGLRRTAQQELTAAAVRGTRWRVLVDPAHATTPFPGL